MKFLDIYTIGVFLFLPLSLQAETPVIGATWAVAEPDALEEIRRTAGAIPWETRLSRSLSGAADRSLPLPDAGEDRSRTFTPVSITPFDVTDKDGNLLYPAGFEYNVLDHVRLPMRIAVFRNRPDHLEWVRRNRKPGDVLILSGPGLNDVMDSLETPVYLLNRTIAGRLGLEHVPCIVEQEQQVLRIREFNLDRSAD